MSKKAFVFYTAVTPAGGRRTLYREDLIGVPGAIVSEKGYTTTSEDQLTYLTDILTSCTYLPTRMAGVDLTDVTAAFTLLFTTAANGQKSSVKGSIHEVYDEVNERTTTMLKLAFKINGDKMVIMLDIDPAA